jgi:hypothetical protein
MTIHLVTLADIHDVQVGHGCAVDQGNVQRFFQAVSSHTEMPLQERHLRDHTFSRDALVEVVQGLDPTPDDAVVFYYSGHGQRVEDKGDRWPYLVLGERATGQVEVFDASWIYQTLRDKNPRMLMLVVDCCNVVVDARTQVVVSPKAARGAPERFVEANYRNLFRFFRGSVLAMAAQPGEPAVGTPVGGLYTNALLDTIRRTVERPNATWDNIMARAGDPLEYEVPGKGKRRQTPVFWVNRADEITLREAPARGLRAVLYADLGDPEQREHVKEALLMLHLAGQECVVHDVGQDGGGRPPGCPWQGVSAGAAAAGQGGSASIAPSGSPGGGNELDEAWDATEEAIRKLMALGDVTADKVLFPALDVFGEVYPPIKWISAGGKLLSKIIGKFSRKQNRKGAYDEPLVAFDGAWQTARPIESVLRSMKSQPIDAEVALRAASGACPDCEANRARGLRFCASCGQELEAQPEPARASAPRFCPSCGTELRSGQRFCAGCGATVGGAEPAVEDVPPIGRGLAASRLEHMQQRLGDRSGSLQSRSASRLDEIRQRLKDR